MTNKKINILTPLDKALAAVGGRQKDLAKLIGVTPQAINLLKKRGGSLPIHKAEVWEAATGLSRQELFPTYYKAA